MKKQAGNIGDIMTTGICILAMTAIMVSYMDIVELLHQKNEVSQLARKYLLRMETIGYLTDADSTMLTEELQLAGVTEIYYTGSTDYQVTYGEPIVLQIAGRLGGEYAFVEKRVSTAKN
ncbi:MAG: hypothetical protein IJF07_05985 [Lachnospiraceae bacterium]|nr:hypothetical protein [Lachnospiraceae bacterium]